MKRIGLRLFQKKAIQNSAKTSFAASAAVPDSGFAFVNNSQGASAALSEFTTAFSTALSHIDLDDDAEGGPFRAQLKLLEKAVGEYSNSSSDSAAHISDWTCSKSTVEIVAIAFKCAASVYKSDPTSAVAHDADDPASTYRGVHREPEADGIIFTELEYARPSLVGTAKAIGFWITESGAGSSGASSHLSSLVVAIRGTEKIIDNMVNLNGRPVPASQFLNIADHLVLGAEATEVEAHSGFLNGAKALLPIVSRNLQKAAKRGVTNVIFTGHSAGGAVASLLYQKFLLKATSSYPNMKFSCITFGSPPTLSIDLTEALNTSSSLKSSRGLNLAFVNEFDMIPRADQSYIRSLIDLYRSIYNLEPLMSETILRHEDHQRALELSMKWELPPLTFSDSDIDAESQEDNLDKADPRWTLPRPEYHIIGKLVLLRKEKKAGSSDKVLRALSISAHEFEKLLYCGIQTHSRTYYEDRVKFLMGGDFNCNMQWQL